MYLVCNLSWSTNLLSIFLAVQRLQIIASGATCFFGWKTPSHFSLGRFCKLYSAASLVELSSSKTSSGISSDKSMSRRVMYHHSTIPMCLKQFRIVRGFSGGCQSRTSPFKAETSFSKSLREYAINRIVLSISSLLMVHLKRSFISLKDIRLSFTIVQPLNEPLVCVTG